MEEITKIIQEIKEILKLDTKKYTDEKFNGIKEKFNELQHQISKDFESLDNIRALEKDSLVKSIDTLIDRLNEIKDLKTNIHEFQLIVGKKIDKSEINNLVKMQILDSTPNDTIHQKIQDISKEEIEKKFEPNNFKNHIQNIDLKNFKMSLVDTFKIFGSLLVSLIAIVTLYFTLNSAINTNTENISKIKKSGEKTVSDSEFYSDDISALEQTDIDILRVLNRLKIEYCNKKNINPCNL